VDTDREAIPGRWKPTRKQITPTGKPLEGEDSLEGAGEDDGPYRVKPKEIRLKRVSNLETEKKFS
jgi:hypothetical protein